MSLDSFLRLLQELLTMVNPGDGLSIECAQTTLRMIVALARDSGKVDPYTLRCMDRATLIFKDLVHHRKDFIGSPGNFQANNAKRQRLQNMLYPSC